MSACYCGHRRDSHDHEDGSGRCSACQCEKFLDPVEARKIVAEAAQRLHRVRRSTPHFALLARERGMLA